MGKTVEEKFLIKLYETAEQKGHWDDLVNAIDVGKSIGQREKSTKTIIQQLARANFIRKDEFPMIYLTENGKSLVKDLQNGY